LKRVPPFFGRRRDQQGSLPCEFGNQQQLHAKRAARGAIWPASLRAANGSAAIDSRVLRDGAD
jgi:hypothetical protein